ncbi:ABC transporter permease [Aerococcus viridans]|uniref:ABC transporter permease n=1 Tax=Aerococcus viridans TaxID=1377 RepID=UPI00223AA9E5|nr:ABC transporter permease [Aerococcus viridans]MCT1797255.1 ABC transporter permease [Aerococcus viridans]
MFLAIKEILYAKKKYSLVVGVMFLIAFLVFFLISLAYGLAMESRMGIDQWQADQIILTEEADGTMSRSNINEEDYDAVDADSKAAILQMPINMHSDDIESDEQLSISLFGIHFDDFIAPEVTEGRQVDADNEALIDDSLTKQYGLGIGDTVTIEGQAFEVVGLTTNTKYSIAPMVHITQNAFRDIQDASLNTSNSSQMPEGEPGQEADNQMINAIVVRGEAANLPDDLEVWSTADFINNLPGYSAQLLTFIFMIGFLILIAAVVIGIFIYVLTIQKIDVFGVMKAQGISTGTIGRSVIVQTFILILTGLVFGVAVTILSIYLLPAQVPTQINWLFFIVVGGLILLCSLIGALFSVKTIVNVDPARAIA